MEKKNLKDFQEFNEERFTKRVIYNHGEGTAFVLNFMPGQALPPHKHPGTELYLEVLQGEGTLIMDGISNQVVQSDIVYCVGEEELAFENTGSESTSLYVVLGKIPSKEFAENI